MTLTSVAGATLEVLGDAGRVERVRRAGEMAGDVRLVRLVSEVGWALEGEARLVLVGGRSIEVLAGRGGSEEWSAASPEAWVVVSGEALQVPDRGVHPLFLGEGAWVGVPVRDEEGVVLGVLLVERERGVFSELEVMLLEAQARVAEMALSQTREVVVDEVTQVRTRSALLSEGRRLGAQSMVVVGMDHFSRVNAELGHAGGDRVLAKVASRLESEVALLGGVLGRVGGDTFGVVLPEGSEIVEVGERLRDAVSEVLAVSGRLLSLSASVGVARGGGRVESLLFEAEEALSEAKRRGRRRVEEFSVVLRERTTRRSEVESLLREGVQSVEVVFQPEWGMRSEGVRSVESLLRWKGREDVSPLELVAAAEDMGVIVELGEEILERACSAMSAWRDANIGAYGVRVWVNASAGQLEGEFAVAVERALKRHGLPGSALGVEVSESAVVGSPERSAAELERLRSLGVRIALDDFGTGGSSLAQLARMPVDVLKIDQVLTERLEEDPVVRSVVGSIVDLGASLGLAVVAEGVERLEQVQILEEMGCTLAQGHFWGEALSADEVGEILPRF